MLTVNFLCIVVFAISLITVVAYKWFYNYWKRHNIHCLQSQFSSSKEHLGIKYKQVYDTIKNNKWKHAGVFLQLTPVLIVANLNLVKNIMTKDFDYFPHRGFYYNEEDPLSCHIFNTSDAKWRNMRTKLNKIFTGNRLKKMFPLILKCEENLLKRIEDVVDIKIVAESFVRDVIESCAFGLDCENFEKESLFEQFEKKIFKRSRIRRVKGFIVDNFPKLGKLLNIALVPKDASDFFLETVRSAVKYRAQNNVFREDFLQVLTTIHNEDQDLLSVEAIAAQCFIFFLAAMSTSPTAISFALYELSKNQDIQEKVRTEIMVILQKHGSITFEAIMEINFLDQVLNETLRKYPPAAYLNRKCVKDYHFGNDVIKKDTTVVIPVLGIHHDNTLYPNPTKFDPDRFEKKSTKENFAFLPFGAGPRICIGMRFGQIQSKFALISLLQKFRFTLNKKTKEPLKMRPEMLVLTAEGRIWLNATKI